MWYLDTRTSKNMSMLRHSQIIAVTIIIIQRGCRTSLVSFEIFSAFSFSFSRRLLLLNLTTYFNRIWSTINFLFLLFITSSDIVHLHTRATSYSDVDFAGCQFSIIMITTWHCIETDTVLPHYTLASIILSSSLYANIVDLSYSKMIWNKPTVFLFVFACNTFWEAISTTIVHIASGTLRIRLLLSLS